MKWNEVTWYSRLGAIILFIFLLPAWTFYIGTKYELTKSVLVQAPIVSSDTQKKIIQPTSTNPPTRQIYIDASSSIPGWRAFIDTADSFEIQHPSIGDLNQIPNSRDSYFIFRTEVNGVKSFIVEIEKNQKTLNSCLEDSDGQVASTTININGVNFLRVSTGALNSGMTVAAVSYLYCTLHQGNLYKLQTIISMAGSAGRDLPSYYPRNVTYKDLESDSVFNQMLNSFKFLNKIDSTIDVNQQYWSIITI